MAANMRKKDTSPNAWKAALLNYRSWVMCLNYGYCFGVELVVDNVITYYLYDQFRLNAVVAGAMGSIFGMVSVRLCCVVLCRGRKKGRDIAVCLGGGCLARGQELCCLPVSTVGWHEWC